MASQPPNPSTPAPSTSNDTPMNESPPKYVPQFSAATEMILKRINSGAGVGASTSNLSSLGISGTPAGYEDMRRTVLMGMKTSMNMEIPSPPPSKRAATSRGAGPVTGHTTGTFAVAGSPAAARQNSVTASGGSGKGRGRGKGAKAGQKRKRAKSESETELTESESGEMSGLGGDSDSDDDEVEIQELPKMTQSGRQIVKPTQFVPAAAEPSPARKSKRNVAPSKRAQEQALCKRCGRGHSPASNMIVFCDGCNLGWHQMCHDPAVSDDMVKDETAAWFCNDCSLKKAKKNPGFEQTRGVSWQGKSTEDKRSYLYSLPHQQLVSLLLQACVLHPNLPIFPPTSNAHPASAFVPPSRPTSSSQSSHVTDRRTNVHLQQPFPPSATAGLFSRAEANPNAPINFIRKIAPGAQTPKNGTPAPEFKHASSAPPTINVTQEDDGSRESTPASPPYPKPGNGLMAKLGPDEEDIEWLVDDGDFEAFSHVVYEGEGVNGAS